MTSHKTTLGDLLHEVDVRAGDKFAELPVLSLTKDLGLIPQAQRFKHRVATNDVSKYKVVATDHIVNNPYVLWEGAIHRLRQGSGLVSPVYPVWATNGLTDVTYLDYMLRSTSLISEYERRAAGTVKRRRSVSKRDFLDIEVNLPSMEAQHVIARTLSSIELSSEAEARRGAALQVLRRTTWTRLLEARESSTETFLFGDIVEVVSGQVDPRAEPFCSLPHVAPDNIEKETGQLLPVRTPKELGLKSGKYAFRAGDVLYSKIRPYLNKAVVAPFEGTCSADMYVLRSNTPRLAQSYLHYLMLAPNVLAQTIAHQGRTGIPKINREQLASISIELPTIDQQQQIAGAMNAIDDSYFASAGRLGALNQLFEESVASLISGAA
jgi:type I restriction enzyme, S subunit